MVAIAIAFFAARELSFLCDDAFITFRYVHNARAGHGLVWNPPPFAPVEGYTSFSWALMLWAAWSWLGVEPPQAANAMSLALGMVQVGIVIVAAHRLVDHRGQRAGGTVVWLTIAAILGNRTFLTWMTGGLETALFNTAVLAWALLGFRRADRRGTRWLLAWSALAALAALTRPDGLLLVAATMACALLTHRPTRSAAAGLLPLLLVAAHIGWRRWFYGAWLPNTYYAKVVTAWPESGLRYLACYVVEHGAWLLPVPAIAALVAFGLRQRRRTIAVAWSQLPRLAVVATMLAHACYYVLIVGGDHFEYRVLSHLAALCGLAMAALLLQLASRQTIVGAGMLLYALAATPAWVHWTMTQPASLHYRELAPHAPSWLRPAVRWYDRQQSWLQRHLVCIRSNEHTLALQVLADGLPARRTEVFDANDPAVVAAGSVGVLGWRLPDVAIIDEHGLNDAVIARTPVAGPSPEDVARTSTWLGALDRDGDDWVDSDELLAGIAALAPGAEAGESTRGIVLDLCHRVSRERGDAVRTDAGEQLHRAFFHTRFLAHERRAPPGYIASFEPNVKLTKGRCEIVPRERPLAADRVRQLERQWLENTRRDGRLRARGTR